MVMRIKPKRAEPSQDEVAISVRGLVTRMGKKVIHDHLDLDVKRGEILGVVGGSGAAPGVCREPRTHSPLRVSCRDAARRLLRGSAQYGRGSVRRIRRGKRRARGL